MPFTIGATLVLSPKESIDLIWGGATRVYNFFSQTALQPAAAVYIAECSIVGGDSEGWRASLATLSQTRPKDGFEIGTLRMGYPGARFLSTLLETPYGSRWLGVLAVVSFITNEYEGTRCLKDFLVHTAPTATQFLLSREQCEKLWNLGREVFAGSPFYYEFLRISAVCLQATDDASLIHQIFATDPKNKKQEVVDISFLVAAYRLWELSKSMKGSGRKLYARGRLGFSQLIFYLTVVCGFHCTVNVMEQELHFGDPSKQIEVEIKVERSVAERSWQTGYCMDDMTITEAVKHELNDCYADQKLWQPGKAAYADRHISRYHVNMSAEISDIDGEFLLTQCNRIKRETADPRLSKAVSRVLASMVHHNLYRWSVVGKAYESDAPKSRSRRRQGRLTALVERTRRAVAIFAPGLIQKTHLEEVLHQLGDDAEPESYLTLTEIVPRDDGLCGCRSAGDHRDGICTRLRDYQSVLSDIARKIWICAQVEFNARALRDVGPDYLWPHSRLKFWDSKAEHTMLIKDFLMEIGGRLAGHEVHATANTAIGMSAGGFIVGVLGNEEQQIEQDSGFVFYIFPGGIEHEEGRLREVYEDPVEFEDLDWNEDEHEAASQNKDLHSSVQDGALETEDIFGQCRLRQFVVLENTRAKLISYVETPTTELRLRSISAIAETEKVIFLHGCLGICAHGNLTQTELSNIDVVDPTKDVVDFRRRRLAVVKAFQNAKVQRAFLWQAGMVQVLIQSGRCIPCAIRFARIEDADVIFC